MPEEGALQTFHGQGVQLVSPSPNQKNKKKGSLLVSSRPCVRQKKGCREWQQPEQVAKKKKKKILCYLKKELLTSPLSPHLASARPYAREHHICNIEAWVYGDCFFLFCCFYFCFLFFFFPKKRCYQEICLKNSWEIFLTHHTILWTFPQRWLSLSIPII